MTFKPGYSRARTRLRRLPIAALLCGAFASAYSKFEMTGEIWDALRPFSRMPDRDLL